MSGTTEIIAETLEKIAQRIDAHKCEMCGAQDSHEVCEQPDLAWIFREVAEEMKGKRDAS